MTAITNTITTGTFIGGQVEPSSDSAPRAWQQSGNAIANGITTEFYLYYGSFSLTNNVLSWTLISGTIGGVFFEIPSGSQDISSFTNPVFWVSVSQSSITYSIGDLTDLPSKYYTSYKNPYYLQGVGASDWRVLCTVEAGAVLSPDALYMNYNRYCDLSYTKYNQLMPILGFNDIGSTWTSYNLKIINRRYEQVNFSTTGITGGTDIQLVFQLPIPDNVISTNDDYSLNPETDPRVYNEVFEFIAYSLDGSYYEKIPFKGTYNYTSGANLPAILTMTSLTNYTLVNSPDDTQIYFKLLTPIYFN